MMRVRLIVAATAAALVVLVSGQLMSSDASEVAATHGAVATVATATPSTPATPAISENLSPAAARLQGRRFPDYGFSQGFQPLNLSAARLAPVLKGIRATGARVIRIDLSWSRIQAGGPSSFDFSNTLRVYEAAIAAGLTVLPVTSGMPAWAGSVAPHSSTSYRKFLYQAGLVLIPLGITTVELWNEANVTGMSPSQYTSRVLIPGSIGFRDAGNELGKTVTIVSSGLAPAKTGGGYYSQVDFLRGIYKAHGRKYFDVVATHPYTWPMDPSVPGNSNWLLNTVQLRAVMTKNHDSDKQIWATEFGFPTNSGPRGNSEQAQASYLRKGAAIWRSFPWAGILIFYSYEDLAAPDSDPENHFGVVSSTGKAKPALAAVKAIIKRGTAGSR